MQTNYSEIEAMLAENERRKAVNATAYDPIVGNASDPERVRYTVNGGSTGLAFSVYGGAKDGAFGANGGFKDGAFAGKGGSEEVPFKVSGTMYIPKTMMREPFVRDLGKAGSYEAYIREVMGTTPDDSLVKRLEKRFVRIRCRHDFEYWAASFVYIKPKGGGADILFRLNRPQRRLVALLEGMRRNEEPIRLIMLKARQWGGSTCVQLYMAWLQLIHMTNLNSLIMAHQGGATDEILDMFHRMADKYPAWLLTDEEEADEDETADTEERRYNRKGRNKILTSGRSRSGYRIDARDCKIKLGTAQRPDAGRGGDYNLIHFSEVALWPSTQNKNPEQIIRATTSGVLSNPMTMIVLESTANGTGNFFHREYQAAKRGESPYEPLFVSWYEIDHYSRKIEDPTSFAAMLFNGRYNDTADSERREPGKYLWQLWEAGATLEAINWYIGERLKCTNHDDMASEYPSDEMEAFAHSGSMVFDLQKIEAMREDCHVPEMKGELEGDYSYGIRSLNHIRFVPSETGGLSIWKHPEKAPYRRVHLNRYLVVVKVGGRTHKTDWSVIAVFDRFGMLTGGGPELVAQWRGHVDMHILAWNAARIATYYNKALLVIERSVAGSRQNNDGDQWQSLFMELHDTDLDLYRRRYCPDEDEEREYAQYGFHSNGGMKPLIVAGLIKAIHERLYVERDEECLKEFSSYEKSDTGRYGACEGANDEILMTRAIGLHVCYNDMDDPIDREDQSHKLNSWSRYW